MHSVCQTQKKFFSTSIGVFCCIPHLGVKHFASVCSILHIILLQFPQWGVLGNVPSIGGFSKTRHKSLCGKGLRRIRPAVLVISPYRTRVYGERLNHAQMYTTPYTWGDNSLATPYGHDTPSRGGFRASCGLVAIVQQACPYKWGMGHVEPIRQSTCSRELPQGADGRKLAYKNPYVLILQKIFAYQSPVIGDYSSPYRISCSLMISSFNTRIRERMFFSI